MDDLLPPEIVWRDKEQFDRGSGTLDILDAALERLERESSRKDSGNRADQPRLQSQEESIYYGLIVEAFGEGAESIVENVGRWSEGRIEG